MSSHLLRAAIRRFLLQIGLVLVVGAASDASAQSNIKAGSGVMAGSNIRHPNGLTFDQVLMTGPTVTVAADPTEVVRVSFVDVNDDITQVEFSGPGSVTVELDNATYQPPAPPAKYHQPGVNYVKGRPTVRVQGAGANSFINIFSVGRGNAVNQALFPAGAVYDAMADVQLLRIEGTDMGGVLTGNVRYGGTLSAIGVEAPNTRVQYRLVIGEIDAQEQAVPLLRIGANSPLVQDGGAVLVAGGDLAQSNGMPIDTASGTGAPLPRINAVAGTLSSGDAVPAKVIGSEFASRDAGTVLVNGVARSTRGYVPASFGELLDEVSFDALDFGPGTTVQFSGGNTGTYVMTMDTVVEGERVNATVSGDYSYTPDAANRNRMAFTMGLGMLDLTSASASFRGTVRELARLTGEVLPLRLSASIELQSSVSGTASMTVEYTSGARESHSGPFDLDHELDFGLF